MESAEVYVRCPWANCGEVLKVQQACRGLLVTCRFCRHLVRVPPDKRNARASADKAVGPPARG